MTKTRVLKFGTQGWGGDGIWAHSRVDKEGNGVVVYRNMENLGARYHFLKMANGSPDTAGWSDMNIQKVEGSHNWLHEQVWKLGTQNVPFCLAEDGSNAIYSLSNTEDSPRMLRFVRTELSHPNPTFASWKNNRALELAPQSVHFAVRGKTVAFSVTDKFQMREGSGYIGDATHELKSWGIDNNIMGGDARSPSPHKLLSIHIIPILERPSHPVLLYAYVPGSYGGQQEYSIVFHWGSDDKLRTERLGGDAFAHASAPFDDGFAWAGITNDDVQTVGLFRFKGPEGSAEKLHFPVDSKAMLIATSGATLKDGHIWYSTGDGGIYHVEPLNDPTDDRSDYKIGGTSKKVLSMASDFPEAGSDILHIWADDYFFYVLSGDGKGGAWKISDVI